MGWIITLGILVLLAILPLGATLRYNADGISLKVIAGPLRIPILPAKKKDPEEVKQKKPKKEKQPKPKQAKEKKPKTAAEKKGGSILDFLPLVSVVLDMLNAFRWRLRVNRLELKLIMAADDPCDLAVNYGKAWAALGNLMPVLDRSLVIKKRDLEVECDFEASDTVIIARLDLTITLGRLIGTLGWHGIRALVQFLKIQNKRKGGALK